MKIQLCVSLVLAAIATTALAQEIVVTKPAQSSGTSVTGKVTFDGKKPEPKMLPSTPEQQKGCCPEGKSVNVADPSLLVDDKGGLANVLVIVEVSGAKLDPPKDPITLDQKQCVFEPHCMIVPAGTKVQFLNSDGVAHNVHIYAAKNEVTNKTIAPGAKDEATFDKAEKVQLKCDYHPWMSSWLLVVDTPYCALTKADGSFSIPGLKPGTYKIKLWHETLGRSEAQAVVGEDGKCAPLDIKMSEPKKKG
jgi:plastocyanin